MTDLRYPIGNDVGRATMIIQRLLILQRRLVRIYS